MNSTNAQTIVAIVSSEGVQVVSSLVACSKSNSIFEDEATRVTSLPYQPRKSLGSLPGKLRKGGGGARFARSCSCNQLQQQAQRGSQRMGEGSKGKGRGTLTLSQ